MLAVVGSVCIWLRRLAADQAKVNLRAKEPDTVRYYLWAVEPGTKKKFVCGDQQTEQGWNSQLG